MSAPPGGQPGAAAGWSWTLSPSALVAHAVDFFHPVEPAKDASAKQPGAPAASRAARAPPPAVTTDRDGFLARLVSFRAGEHAAAWAAQPAAIGAVAAARHGWHAAPRQRELTVTCRECSASLLCKAKPMPWESRDEAAKTFRPQLQEAHGSTCPWRDHTFGVDDAGAASAAAAPSAEERKAEEARRAAAAAAELVVRDKPGL